jgi:hypothetical protein
LTHFRDFKGFFKQTLLNQGQGPNKGKIQMESAMDQDQKKRIISLRKRILTHFDPDHWAEIGLLTGFKDLIDHHPRLIRSLKWEYHDYADNVLEVLNQIGLQKVDALDDIERYLDDHFPKTAPEGPAESTWSTSRFLPISFEETNADVELDLVAIIMPFDKAFDPVNDALKAACADAGYRALRPDDIWEQSTIIMEIINLLYRAAIVVSDFTGKNPNVMYETGVSHTLGKLVIPISQTLDDVPFDLAHHRILKYATTRTGLFDLQHKLSSKLNSARVSSKAASI